MVSIMENCSLGVQWYENSSGTRIAFLGGSKGTAKERNVIKSDENIAPG